LDNACGIIACLHSILNNLDTIQLNPESILHKFYEDTKAQNPDERATSLENNNEFKAAHKVHASQGQSALCEN
jgi:ubiquitin carboxyl-terminal hydrolase L3